MASTASKQAKEAAQEQRALKASTWAEFAAGCNVRIDQTLKVLKAGGLCAPGVAEALAQEALPRAGHGENE